MSSVKVQLNASAIGALKKAMSDALVMTGTEVLSEERNMAVMPMDTGHTEQDATHVDDSQASAGHVEIVTNAPQARRLYFNPQYNFRQDHNANAGGEWWEPWISGSKRGRPKELYGKFLKLRAGGLIK